MDKTENIISQTKKWIIEVVMGCNFCPFAGKVIKMDTVHYQVETSTDSATILSSFWQECQRLDKTEAIETSLLIFPDAFSSFSTYLDLVHRAERLLKTHGYEGIYQVASFHPLYRFAGSAINDAANYTNRSPYPMLHLLREELVEKALSFYPDPGKIPERNIDFARQKGELYMKMLRDSSMK